MSTEVGRGAAFISHSCLKKRHMAASQHCHKLQTGRFRDISNMPDPALTHLTEKEMKVSNLCSLVTEHISKIGFNLELQVAPGQVGFIICEQQMCDWISCHNLLSHLPPKSQFKINGHQPTLVLRRLSEDMFGDKKSFKQTVYFS